MSDETKCPDCGAALLPGEHGGVGVYECGNRTVPGLRPPACVTIARLTGQRDEARARRDLWRDRNDALEALVDSAPGKDQIRLTIHLGTFPRMSRAEIDRMLTALRGYFDGK